MLKKIIEHINAGAKALEISEILKNDKKCTITVNCGEGLALISRPIMIGKSLWKELKNDDNSSENVLEIEKLFKSDKNEIWAACELLISTVSQLATQINENTTNEELIKIVSTIWKQIDEEQEGEELQVQTIQ